MSGLSQINLNYTNNLLSGAQINKPQTPVFQNNNVQYNLPGQIQPKQAALPEKNSFLKEHKKAIIAGSVAAGAIASCAAFVILAKNGKLGAKCQDFVGGIIDNFRGTAKKDKIQFINDAGEKIKVSFKDGKVFNSSGSEYTGTLTYKTKGKNPVEIKNEYTDGLLQKSYRNGAIYREYTRRPNTVSFKQYGANGSIEQIYTKYTKEGKVAVTTDNLSANKAKHTLITPDKIITTDYNTETDAATAAEHYIMRDKKTGKILQEGFPDKTHKLKRDSHIIVIEKGDKKYYYELPNLIDAKYSAEQRIPEIGVETRTGNQDIPFLIEQTLDNGVVKFNCIGKVNNNVQGMGLIFPTGDIIGYDGVGCGFYCKEYETDGIGHILGEKIKPGYSQYFPGGGIFGLNRYVLRSRGENDNKLNEKALKLLKRMVPDDEICDKVINYGDEKFNEFGVGNYNSHFASFGRWQDGICTGRNPAFCSEFLDNAIKFAESFGI